MKKFMCLLVLCLVSCSCFGVLLPVTNGEFDEGENAFSVIGWKPTGTVNKIHYNPQGSMEFWDEQYRAPESHVRYGWKDGCKLWQNDQVATLNTIEADTIYTMTVRAKVSIDSATEGIGLELNNATDWNVIVDGYFYNTGGLAQWNIYSISFDTSQSEYSGLVGKQLAPAVVNKGGNNFQMVDYVRIDASPIPEPTTITLLGIGLAFVTNRLGKKK